MDTQERWYVFVAGDDTDPDIFTMHRPSGATSFFPSVEAAKREFFWVDWVDVTDTNREMLEVFAPTNVVSVGLSKGVKIPSPTGLVCTDCSQANGKHVEVLRPLLLDSPKGAYTWQSKSLCDKCVAERRVHQKQVIRSV